jgi:hypothetical protein
MNAKPLNRKNAALVCANTGQYCHTSRRYSSHIASLIADVLSRHSPVAREQPIDYNICVRVNTGVKKEACFSENRWVWNTRSRRCVPVLTILADDTLLSAAC